MSWQYTPYSLLLIAAAAASLGVAIAAYRVREKRGALAFVTLMCSLALWAVSDAAQLANTTLSGKLFFRTLGYVGHNLVPVSLVVFALDYTGRRRWLKRGTIAAIAVEPLLVAFVITPTNALGWHGLIWSSVTLETVDSTVVLTRTFGPWYWLNTAYNYVLVLVGLGLFARLFRQQREAMRKQGAAVLVGSVLPFAANIVWVAGATTIDLTPIAFAFTGVVFGVAFYRYGLLELAPIARNVVLDEMADPYLVLDTEDRIIDLNDPAASVLSTHGPVLGRPAASILPTIHGGLRGREETALETDEGKRYFEIWETSLGVGGRLVFMRDITERRSVERRYQALIENASDLIVVLDPNRKITYISPACERILGHDPEALIGTDAFDHIHPDDRDWVRERIRQERGQATSEYRVQRADGAWIWLESRGTDLFDDPAVEGYVVNARDVTDRKQREQALRRQNERLESFASVAAHDLRNPLNIIEGHLSMARETGAEYHFDAIDQAAERMETLVDDLLLLAREGKIVDETEAVELETIVRTAWTNVETGTATLDVDIDDRMLAADRSRLSSLFENLFRNSVEHGSTGSRTQSDDSVEHGGADVTVRVGPTPTGFYVEDDGTGIPLEARNEIFDRGFSTEANGTGLGLPIIQGVATAHGWTVELDDTDGDWTRFEVSGVEWITDETVQETDDETVREPDDEPAETPDN